jgi:UDP-N-acetylmuramyl pentapeptide synthase
LLTVGMLGQVLTGLALLFAGLGDDIQARMLIGVAVILATPIVWAHLLFLLGFGWQLLHIKRYGKDILCRLLEQQVNQLRERNEFTLVAVAGSVGKTSTKLAIAQTLQAAGQRVQFQEGNYNDRLTVPLVIFGASEPAIYNLAAWLRMLWQNQRNLRQAYPYDVVVVELGVDGPGQMRLFEYLRPELSVVTAVSEEHMAFFKTIEAVAKEELSVFDFSTQVLVNTDDVSSGYLQRDSYVSYGLDGRDYQVALAGKPTGDGQKLNMKLQHAELTYVSKLLGSQGAKVALAAAAVAHMLNIEPDLLKTAVESLRAFAGRMQLLRGKHDSLIIDDTYNASPKAVTAALDVLYSLDAPQRIAILGGMNEMGALSPELHQQVGAYCDPKKLDAVITIGHEAKQYLAPAAKEAGCEVHSYNSPQAAGKATEELLKHGAVVLVKGSQNGVFAEEAVKPLLFHKQDAEKLVRQSPYWMKIKRSQFGA